MKSLPDALCHLCPHAFPSRRHATANNKEMDIHALAGSIPPAAHSACKQGIFKMRYNQLGNTGLFVSRLCLGTMTFGEAAADLAPGRHRRRRPGHRRQDRRAFACRRRQLHRYGGRLFVRRIGDDPRPGRDLKSQQDVGMRHPGHMSHWRAEPSGAPPSAAICMGPVEWLERLQADTDLYRPREPTRSTPIDEPLRCGLVSNGMVM